MGIKEFLRSAEGHAQAGPRQAAQRAQRATQTPELKKAFEQQLTQVYTNTPAEFRAFVGKEFKERGPVIKAAGLKVE